MEFDYQLYRRYSYIPENSSGDYIVKRLFEVIYAARTASEPGFETFIVDDACAAWSPEMHLHTLQSFSLLFGQVLRTDELIEKIGEKL